MNPEDDFVYVQRTPLYGGFSEGDLVEQPAIDLFQELGWAKANLFSEFAKGKSSEGRESKREAHLSNRLRAALSKLNPNLPESAIDEAYLAVTRERAAIDPIRANGEFHDLLRDGVKIKLRGKSGALQDETIRVIDWDEPANNDFLIANQVWFAGDLYTRRADLIGFVNGLPLLFLELKALHRSMEDAYNDNLRDYRTAIPHIFVPCAFAILSNGIDTVMGAPLAPFEYFAEWKKIDREEEEGFVSLETLIRGICKPERFLDLVENFIAFEEGKQGLIKKVAKTHQFLGVNKAIAAVEKLQENQGRLGVFWHTQGSGKSLSMLFFSRKVLRKLPGNWTFLIVTDRTELDDQIADTFSACGALVKPRQEVQAGSREHLKQLLRGDERFIFTLVQKFGTETGETFPVLSERSDIIVITDEAHRSQYDVLAGNMRKALPNAAFLGFTGTPLIAGEEQRTREVFGDYISVYDFAQSIADGATVPLYYESRLPELQLENKELDSDIATVLEEADLDDVTEDKLKKRFARAYHLITNDDRLEKVADDLVKHFSRRGYRGKAMFIAIDKATAVRMFDKVKRRWAEMIAREQLRLATIADQTERAAKQEQLDWLSKTDMAVVVSQSQNEIELMAEQGLDIRTHRERLVKENLDERFKADNDPLRLVFVCAMWITGFDVPTCSTVYLDKPMRNHTLMQTIARANRVAPDKKAGLIVDYVGVFRNLKDALAVYGGRVKSDGEGPIRDKVELVAQLEMAMRMALLYAESKGVIPKKIIEVKGFERQAKLREATEALLGEEKEVKAYLSHADSVWRLFKAVLPDESAMVHHGNAAVLRVIAEMIRSLGKKKGRNLSEVIAEIERLVDEAVTGASISAPIPSGDDLHRLLDLSTIDFEKLADLFNSGARKTATEALKGKVEDKARSLASKNPTRIDILERLQALIDQYNTGSMGVEELFEDLKNFTGELDVEEARHLREGLTEEELAIFDILTRPEPKLSKAQEVQVKKIAGALLTKLKREKLILDWRLKESAKASVREAIREEFDHLPEVYERKIWEEKVERTYQFVFEQFGA